MTLQISPRKTPRQSRSQATVTAILDATARILVERGCAAASTNAVAERADVSVGSLYPYFPNKEAPIAALKLSHGEQMMAVIQRAFTQAMDATLDDALTGLVQAAIEAHRVDADLHRVLEAQHDGDGDAKRQPDLNVMEKRIAALLARHRDQITAPDLKLAAFMLMHAAHSLVHAVVLQRPRGIALKPAAQEIVWMLRAHLSAPRAQVRRVPS